VSRLDAPENLLAPALAGEQRAIGRLLTHAETSLADAAEILRLVSDRPRTGAAVGFVGPPGVGKSTLVSAVVAELRVRGRRVAVLANDPSGAQSGGALLGDRVRMAALGRDPDVFIRSVAARDPLRSLNATTFCAVALLTRLGFDDVLVEAVGAGQSDIGTSVVADSTVLVMAPGLGDDVQAMKSGVMEVADVIAVNKSDLPHAKRAASDLRQAVKAAATMDDPWIPPVVQVVAAKPSGIARLLAALADHRAHLATRSATVVSGLFVDLVLFEGSRRLRHRAMQVDMVDGSDTEVIRGALAYVDAVLPPADSPKTPYRTNGQSDRVGGVPTTTAVIEIHELNARYNRAADGTVAADLLSLFAEDAEFEMRGAGEPTVYRGAEIGALVARAPDQRVHMTMDSIVCVEGETATQECTLLLCTRSRTRELGAFFTGRYSDELVLTEAGWRFKRRVAEVDFEHEARFQLVSGAS
jgi:LAO/AO transport system kinase